MSKPDRFESLEMENKDFSRRAFIQVVLAGAASAMIPKIAEAQTPPVPAAPEEKDKKNALGIDPYFHIRQRMRKELGAETSPDLGHPLSMALDELPMLYYDHNVQNKIHKKFVNIPTPSMVFEVSKAAFFAYHDQVGSLKGRRIQLDKLKRAAEPGVDKKPTMESKQKRMTEVHEANEPIIDRLEQYWAVIEKESLALVKKVMSIVMKERAAAKAMKTASDANSDVSPFVPIGSKNPELQKKQQAEFDNYDPIEGWLQPYPYECDVTNKDLTAKPSSVYEVEAAKALKHFAQFHLEAALQRREKYEAIKAFVQLTGPKAKPLLKFDGSRYNDKILEEWRALLDEHGPIERQLELVSILSEFQANQADKIKRCVSEINIDEEGNATVSR